MHRRLVNSLSCLLIAALAPGCHTGQSNADFALKDVKWADAALLVASDGVVCGELRAGDLSGLDPHRIQIGSVPVFVGGNGLEVSPSTLDRLRSLDGASVVAGVLDVDFTENTVQVLAALGDAVALDSASKFRPLIKLRSSLLGRTSWDQIVEANEGRWNKLQSSFASMSISARDHAVQSFLESGEPTELARDVCGWLASVAGRRVNEWRKPHRVTVSGRSLRATSVRMVAKWIIEACIEAPPNLTYRFAWGSFEQCRRTWALIELRRLLATGTKPEQG